MTGKTPNTTKSSPQTRSLVYTPADRAIKSVFIHDHPMVADGKVLTLDPAAALAAHTQAPARRPAP